MLISRQLANKVTNRLLEILNLMRTGDIERAANTLHDLAAFINRYVESEKDEKARAQREERRA